MKTILGVLLVLSSSIFGETHFDNLGVAFSQATQPMNHGLDGYWAGRCVHQGDPNTEWPAFYVLTRVETTAGHLLHYSQSHLWFEEQTDKYDSFTVEDVLANEVCKNWFANEQWNPITSGPLGLVTGTQYAGHTLWRVSRLYFDGYRNHILLAYSRGWQPTFPPTTYCYFNYRLPSSAPLPPTPIDPVPVDPTPVDPTPVDPTPVDPNPAPVADATFLGKASPVKKGDISVDSQAKGDEFTSLIFINRGQQAISIKNVSVRISGAVVNLEGTYSLVPGKAVTVDMGTVGEKIKRVEFYSTGATSSIEIYGTNETDSH